RHRLLKCHAGIRECRRLSSLERIDRLLFIAHGKYGALHAIARPMPGEKFLRQLSHDRPLRWARVLRLIDQDVVDTAIELVLNPWPHVRAGKEVHGTLNEIVEVQKSARTL